MNLAQTIRGMGVIEEQKPSEKPENDSEYNDEGGMALTQLKTAQDAVSELMGIIKKDDNLPEWVQSKLTKAVDYMDSVRDYLSSEGKMNEEVHAEEENLDDKFEKIFEEEDAVEQIDEAVVTPTTLSFEETLKSVLLDEAPKMKYALVGKDMKIYSMGSDEKDLRLDRKSLEQRFKDAAPLKIARLKTAQAIGDKVDKSQLKEEEEDAVELDPVNKKALKKKFADRKDKDIDNDGDVDGTDKYLHKKRKAISKAMKKDDDNGEDEYKDIGKTGKQTKVDTKPSLDESEMSDAEMKKREEIVKSMKDKEQYFKDKYGDRWKEVMYATATKMAQKLA